MKGRRGGRDEIGIIMEHYEGYVGMAILFWVRWEQDLRVLSSVRI